VRTLTFETTDTGEPVELTDFRTVVAGYTGRDEAALRRHIAELAAIGIPEPDSVPAFFPVDSALVTHADEIAVSASNTSGEVEPVLVRAAGRLYLGVGSDHTDRDLERTDIAASKAACPKPLGPTLLPIPDRGRGFDWDAVGVRSRVDGRLYQDATLRSLRVPTDVLGVYGDVVGDDGGDLVMFGGTVPLLDGTFVAGVRWDLSLRVDSATTIEHSYSATTGSV